MKKRKNKKAQIVDARKTPQPEKPETASDFALHLAALFRAELGEDETQPEDWDLPAAESNDRQAAVEDVEAQAPACAQPETEKLEQHSPRPEKQPEALTAEPDVSTAPDRLRFSDSNELKTDLAEAIESMKADNAAAPDAPTSGSEEPEPIELGNTERLQRLSLPLDFLSSTEEAPTELVMTPLDSARLEQPQLAPDPDELFATSFPDPAEESGGLAEEAKTEVRTAPEDCAPQEEKPSGREKKRGLLRGLRTGKEPSAAPRADMSEPVEAPENPQIPLDDLTILSAVEREIPGLTALLDEHEAYRTGLQPEEEADPRLHEQDSAKLFEQPEQTTVVSESGEPDTPFVMEQDLTAAPAQQPISEPEWTDEQLFAAVDELLKLPMFGSAQTEPQNSEPSEAEEAQPPEMEEARPPETEDAQPPVEEVAQPPETNVFERTVEVSPASNRSSRYALSVSELFEMFGLQRDGETKTKEEPIEPLAAAEAQEEPAKAAEKASDWNPSDTIQYDRVPELWDPLSLFSEAEENGPPPFTPLSRDTTGSLPSLEELFGAAPEPSPRAERSSSRPTRSEKKRGWLRGLTAIRGEHKSAGVSPARKSSSPHQSASSAPSRAGGRRQVSVSRSDEASDGDADEGDRQQAYEASVTTDENIAVSADPDSKPTSERAGQPVRAPAPQTEASEESESFAGAEEDATVPTIDEVRFTGIDSMPEEQLAAKAPDPVRPQAEPPEPQTVPMDLRSAEPVTKPVRGSRSKNGKNARSLTLEDFLTVAVPMEEAEPPRREPPVCRRRRKQTVTFGPSTAETITTAQENPAGLILTRSEREDRPVPAAHEPRRAAAHSDAQTAEPVPSAAVRAGHTAPHKTSKQAESRQRGTQREMEILPPEEKSVLHPDEAYRVYARPLDEIGSHLILTGLFTILSLFFTLYLSQHWTFLPELFSGGATVYILLAFLGMMVLVNRKLYFREWRSVDGLRPELLLGAATLFTALDCFEAAKSLRPPFTVVVGALLMLALWGRYDRGMALITTVKVLRAEQLSAGVSEVQDITKGSRGLVRSKPDVDSFMEKLETRDLTDRVLRVYTPAAAVGGLVLTLLISLGLKQPLLWTGALVFLGSVPATGLLAFPRLFYQLANRLSGAHAALCGYHGAEVFGGEHAILIGDDDIFPAGSLTLNGFKVYHGNPDRMIAYAAAACRSSGSALDPVFEDLLVTHNGRHYTVDNFRFYDSGGIGASIMQDVVLLGSLDFMRRMGVHMDKGTRVKQAVYMSLNGELAAVFAVRYTPPENLRRGLAALAGNRHFKGILVTRTFLGTPGFLKVKFGIPTGAFQYPSTKERIRLSEAEMKRSGAQGAILAKDSFSGFAQAAASGRLLHSATLCAAILTVLEGLTGLLLMGILAALPAIETATALNLLLYTAAWLAPTLLLTLWARHF